MYSQILSNSIKLRHSLHIDIVQYNRLSFASEISLLLGQQEFDFSNVINEPCTARSNSKQIKVKVTACGSGSFTCNDGECVSIDERCDQISNCRSVLSIKFLKIPT